MKLLGLVLAIALAFNSTAFALPATQPADSAAMQTKDERQAAKIKAEVQKRGTGEQSRVRVSLRNGKEVKGYVSQMDDTSFQVTDPKTGTAMTIPFVDAAKVRGPGWSRGAKIGIGAGIGAGAVVAVLGILAASFHGN